MKQFLYSTLVNFLSPARVFPTRASEKNDVHALIKKLYPMKTDKELIRLGPNGDGGYLVPNDFEGIEACFSPGVSLISGFEKDCANMGMKTFLADKSVEKPAETHELFSFVKKYIGAYNNDDFMTLDSWVSNSLEDQNSELILQIDIEGYEYEVFLSASEHLMNRFRIITAEFHFLDCFWSKPFFGLARTTFEKILKTHTCVHIHPNNCGGIVNKKGLKIPKLMEFTFLRNDRISFSESAKSFPHKLDYNNTDFPDLLLPKCWYGE